MATRTTTVPASLPPLSHLPPLEPGDHLTREEFERRFDATPGLKKAELIEGVVHMPPAVRFEHHSSPNADLVTWLGLYRAATPGVRVGDNGSVRLDLDNEPQPDAFLFIEAASGGQVKLSADDYVEGAPELVAEVSASTASIDMNSKLRVYRRNGVREYLVWRVSDRAIDWLSLRQGVFEPLPIQSDGIIRSEVFPGLWLDPVALIRSDAAAVLDVLRRGLATPEHAQFIAKLHSRREQGGSATRPGR